MSLPAGVATVTVNIGPYLDHSGEPRRGVVAFTAPTDVVHLTTGAQLVPSPVEVTLGADGSGQVVLAATDDPNLAPTDFTYTVSFNIRGTRKSTTTISLPAAAPVVDLELLVEVPASSGLVVESPAVLSVNGQTGAVTVEGATDEAVETLVADPDSATRAAVIAAGSGTYVLLPEGVADGTSLVLVADSTAPQGFRWAEGGTTGGTTTDALLTESGDTLTTEAGDVLTHV